MDTDCSRDRAGQARSRKDRDSNGPRHETFRRSPGHGDHNRSRALPLSVEASPQLRPSSRTNPSRDKSARDSHRVSRGWTSRDEEIPYFSEPDHLKCYDRTHTPRHFRDNLPSPPPPKTAPPPPNIGNFRFRDEPTSKHQRFKRGLTSRDETTSSFTEPGDQHGYMPAHASRDSRDDIPPPTPLNRNIGAIRSRDEPTSKHQRFKTGLTTSSFTEPGTQDKVSFQLMPRVNQEVMHHLHPHVSSLTSEGKTMSSNARPGHLRGHDQALRSRDETTSLQASPLLHHSSRTVQCRNVQVQHVSRGRTSREDEFSPEAELRHRRGYDRARSSSSRDIDLTTPGRTESPNIVWPKELSYDPAHASRELRDDIPPPPPKKIPPPPPNRSIGAVRSRDEPANKHQSSGDEVIREPKRMSISPDSQHRDAPTISWPDELGYDKALSLLWKDENLADVDISSEDKDEENKVANGAINEPYDPSAAIEAQQLNSYLLMKNDIMILGNKYVENMIHTAGQIWSRLFNVQAPLIRVPKTPSEFVYFKMQSYEDKVKVLKMCKNKALGQKTQFMGTPTYVKDANVSPLPLAVAQAGTREEALDALKPLRNISYDDQIAARSDLIKKMLKDVVTRTRGTLNCLPDSNDDMAHCFYNKPDLKDLVRMGKLAGYSRYNIIDLGYHRGEPVPGVRVYYGKDDAPKAFLLPLEDCAHISPAIVKTSNELFECLINGGFAIFDPWNNQGNLVKFRVLMNSFGKIIVTVELALDDEFVESFEPIFYNENPYMALGDRQRPMYPPEEVPSLIPEYKFMKENSLREVPPTQALVKSGGVEQLRRIRPVLQTFHDNYGQKLGIAGIYITWYYVNERPVEWDRNAKIWHHVCGSNFINEVIMDVTLDIYPNISCPHFPHIQAFPKILQEIVEITRVNKSSRVMVLSEYSFLAEFFGLKCSRTIFLKTAITTKERSYLEHSLPPDAIKFLSPLEKKRQPEDLEPGGDIVIIWGGVRTDDFLRSVAIANYRRVIFVRDGFRRVKHDKADTFIALHQISKCLFPYMALAGAVAIDVEPHGNTMPAIISVFTRAPNAPKPLAMSQASTPSHSNVPTDQVVSPVISNQPGFGFQPQPSLVAQSELENPPKSRNSPDFRPHPHERGWQPQGPPGNTGGNLKFGVHSEDLTSAMARGDHKRGHSIQAPPAWPQDLPPGEADGSHKLSFRFKSWDKERVLQSQALSPGTAGGSHTIGGPKFGTQPDLPPVVAGIDRKHSHPFFGDVGKKPGFQLEDLPRGNAGGSQKLGFQSKGSPHKIPLRDHERGLHPQEPLSRNPTRRPEVGFSPGGPPSKMAKVDRNSEMQPQDRSFGISGRKPGIGLEPEGPSSKILHHDPLLPQPQDAGAKRQSELQPRRLPPEKDGDFHDSGFKPQGHPHEPARGDRERQAQPGGSTSATSTPTGDQEQNHETSGASKTTPKRRAPTISDFDVQSIIRYILQRGGPSRIHIMPIDVRVNGWDLLADLKKCVKKQKEHGGVSTLPKWYLEFLTEFGYPNPYKKVRMEEDKSPDIPPNAPNQKSTSQVQLPFEAPARSQEPLFDLRELLSKPPEKKTKNPKLKQQLTTSDPEVHAACRSQASLPFEVTARSREPLFDSQELLSKPSEKKRKKSKLGRELTTSDPNTRVRLPFEVTARSREPLFDSRELLSILPEKKGKKPKLKQQLTTSDPEVHAACRYIMEQGGPDFIDRFDLPDSWVSGESNVQLLALQRKMKKFKTRDGTPSWSKFPKWYKQFLTEHGLPVAKWTGSKQTADSGDFPQEHPEYKPEVQTLVNYIMENGGPESVETMTVPETMDQSCRTMLSLLQQIIANARKMGRNHLCFPRWFAQFLVDYGLPAPTIRNAADKEPSTPDYLKNPKQLKEYIFKHGGHSKIEEISINSEIPGWKLLFGLQTTLRNMKKMGITLFKGGVRAYPPWYHSYLAEYEPNLSVPPPDSDAVVKANPQGKEGCSQNSQPSQEAARALAEHIIQNGGPWAIETMPLPEKHSQFIAKLQTCIINQKNNVCTLTTLPGHGKVSNLPAWYKKFLLDHGLNPREFFPHLILTDHDLQAPKPEQLEHIWEPALPALPVGKPDSESKLQQLNQESLKARKHIYHYTDLANYILENGGPDNIETMSVTTDAITEKCKEKLTHLQKTIAKLKEGCSVVLPPWYIQFLDDYGFPAPPSLKTGSGIVKHMDLRELKEYILKNGGHSKIETMPPPDSSVPHYRLFKGLRFSLRRQIKRGGITYYPDWYWDYLAEHEPDVKLPDNVTRKSLVPSTIDSDLPADPYSCDNSGDVANQDQPVKPWRSPPHRGPAKGTIPNAPGTGAQPTAYMARKLGVYIMSIGGPKEIVNMPLPPIGYLGRNFLAKLQRTLTKQKNGGGITYYPDWYWDYLAEHEPDVKLPDNVTRKSLVPSTIDSDLPADPYSCDNSGDVANQDQPVKPWRSPPHRGPAKGTIPNAPGTGAQPTAYMARKLGVYIMSIGGPKEIVNMPLPPIGYLGRNFLAKLQRTLTKQKNGDPLFMWLPIWYKKFLLEYGFDAHELYPYLSEEQLAIPPEEKDTSDKSSDPSAQTEGPPDQPEPCLTKQFLAGPASGVGRSPEEILTDPKVRSAMKYVDDNGGPECVETMPLPTQESWVEGWQLVSRVQNCFINQKTFTDRINLLPVWYILYLMRRGDPVPSHQYVDRFGRTHLSVNALGEPLETLDPPPFDFSTFNPDTFGLIVPSRLADYIKLNGGHAQIDNMPIDYSVPGFRLLYKFQQSIKKQLKSKDGCVWRYPKWYREYLAEHEPNVELPTPPQSKNEAAIPSQSEPNRRTAASTESEPQRGITAFVESERQLETIASTKCESPTKNGSTESEPQKDTPKSTDSEPQLKITAPAESEGQQQTSSTKYDDHQRTDSTSATCERQQGTRSSSVECEPTKAKPQPKPTKSAKSEPPLETTKSADPELQSKRTTKSAESEPLQNTIKPVDSEPTPTPSTCAESELQQDTTKSTESVPVTTDCTEFVFKNNITRCTASEPQKEATKSTDSELQAKMTTKSTESEPLKNTIKLVDSEPTPTPSTTKSPESVPVTADCTESVFQKITTCTESEAHKEVTKSTDPEPLPLMTTTSSKSESQQRVTKPANAKPPPKTTNHADSDLQMQTRTSSKPRKKTNDSQPQATSSTPTESEPQQDTSTESEPKPKTTKSTNSKLHKTSSAESTKSARTDLKSRKKATKANDSKAQSTEPEPRITRARLRSYR